MSAMAAMELPEWEAAGNGASKRPWFIQRKGADRGNWPGGMELYYLVDRKGDAIKFKSYETAQKRVNSLNAHDGRICSAEIK